MNKKTMIKILLDITMAILFIILLDANGTGLAFHEIAGLGIFGMFATHLVLNGSWVKRMTKNLFKPSIKQKAKLMYALNAALLLSITTITVTGIMISEVVFGFGSSGSPKALYIVHEWVSYGCLGLFGVHLALHRQFLLNSLRTMLFNPKGSKVIRTFKSIGATVLIVVTLYALVIPNADSAATPTPVTTPATTSASSASSPSSSSSSSTSSTKSASSSSSNSVTSSSTNTTTSQSSSSSVNSPTTSTSTVTLSQYLGGFFCTACHKHCPLSNPQCGKAQPQIQTATIKYQQLYGSSDS